MPNVSEWCATAPTRGTLAAMFMKTADKLSDIDVDDIVELIPLIEDSFGFSFLPTELEDVATFGEFCEKVKSRIDLIETNDCTSQQAFYKLRSGIAQSLTIDSKQITTNSDLKTLFPKQNRLQKIKDVEKLIGFKINALKPSEYISASLGIIFLGSVVYMFFNWKIGLCGTIFSILGYQIALRFGKTFSIQTVGELADKISRENYLKSRRNPKTFNPKEVETKLKDLFVDKFFISREALRADARFVE